MPDGMSRPRRNGMRGLVRMKWYAYWRTLRFNIRFGLVQKELV